MSKTVKPTEPLEISPVNIYLFKGNNTDNRKKV